MNITIFDNFTTVYDHPDTISVEDTIDTLDQMLNEAGIEHFFSLPFDAESKEDGRIPVLLIGYKSEDHMEFGLIYTRYALKVRRISEKKVAEALIKLAAGYIEEG